MHGQKLVFHRASMLAYSKEISDAGYEVYYVSYSKNEWLVKFFQNRFSCFGNYEDAIINNSHFLYHIVY